MLPTLCLIIYKLLEEIVFPSGSESKERVYLQCGRPRLIPGLGRYPGEGNGSPLQYSCLENPIHGDFQSPNPWGHKESDMTEQLTHSLEGITTQLAIAVISTCNIIIKSNRALWFPENNKVSLLTVNLVAQMVKHLPAIRETGVQSLGQEDPLEKERAVHSSSLACKSPWMEEPDTLQFMGLQRVRHD